jgi:hypothetical protein
LSRHACVSLKETPPRRTSVGSQGAEAPAGKD